MLYHRLNGFIINKVVYYTCICPNLHYYFPKSGKISKTFSFSDIVILLKFDAQIAANDVSESLNFKICRGRIPPDPPK